MEATSTMKRANLQVPGASLYYEVRGSGPVLLMMPGGPADATTFRRIEDTLASKYTVVTYDPRDLSHSKVDEPTDDARMIEIYADDAYRLLEAVGPAPASIFASSGGAVIAMELAVRHPDQLDVVVFHEPPSPDLQRDSVQVRAAMEHIGETFAGEGLMAAAMEFMHLVRIEGGPPPPPEGEPTLEQLEAMALMQKNINYFFGRYVPNLARYRPDLAALKACTCRLVPAVGADSTGQLAHDGGLGLARVLGTEATVFPGDHGGFDGRAAEFGPKLLEVLEGRSR